MADLLFIHVPKTAGMSISRFCKKADGPTVLRGNRPHSSAESVRRKVGEEAFDGATKFAVVRNPIDRYSSACRFLGINPNAKWVKGRAELGRVTSFPTALLQTQTSLLYIDGALAVDKLFRFEEDVPEAVYAWLIEQGFDGETQAQLPHLHKVRRPTQELTEETIEWIRSHYAEDFANFGYE